MSFTGVSHMSGNTEGGYEFSDEWKKLMAECEDKKKRWAEKRLLKDTAPAVVVKNVEETAPTVFCHCGSMATAGITVKDESTGEDIRFSACRRCHPNAAKMMDTVRDVMSGKMDSSEITFTPEQMLETLYAEEEKAYPNDKDRTKGDN